MHETDFVLETPRTIEKQRFFAFESGPRRIRSGRPPPTPHPTHHHESAVLTVVFEIRTRTQDGLKRSAKSSSGPDEEDVPRISQNARPTGPYGTVPEVLLRYLSVGPDGAPLLTTIGPDAADRRTDYYAGWTDDDDYVDVPGRRRLRRSRQPRRSSFRAAHRTRVNRAWPRTFLFVFFIPNAVSPYPDKISYAPFNH